MRLSLTVLCLAPPATAFRLLHPVAFSRQQVVLHDGKIGIFFGTSTGSTEGVADLIKEEFGGDATGPIDIDGIKGNVAAEFAKYDALIVGTPTWNTGADTERSGTGWDEVYYGEMQDLGIKGKKVAVFGLGDSDSYSQNYADGAGELHNVFENLGCKMLGYVSQEGYEHEASKAIRGDRFCGLMLDVVNQEELTEERVKNWVVQLKNEGILDGAAATVTTTNPADTTVTPSDSSIDAAKIIELEEEIEKLRELLRRTNLQPDLETGTYTPHTNPKTGKTMWVSSDGRTCYYTNSPKQRPAFAA